MLLIRADMSIGRVAPNAKADGGASMRQVPALVLATVLAVPARAQTSLFDQGDAAMRRGDFATAADLFSKAVAQAPKDANYHYWLANAYRSLASAANIFKAMSLAGKIRQHYETAVELDPDHLQARMALLEFLSHAPAIAGGGEKKAIEQANEIRKRDALMGHLAFLRIYTFAEKPDLARKEVADAVREQPSSPQAHYWKGVYLIRIKELAGARDEFETSVELDPGYMPAWFQIGHVAALTGNNLARGEEALKRYLAYRPSLEEPWLDRAHYWLGGVYEKQGRKAEAKAAYTAALRLNPTSKDAADALKRLS